MRCQTRKAFIIIFMLLLAMVDILQFITRTQATTTTMMYVDPSVIVGESYAPTQNITVEIKVANIPPSPGVCGAQFRLEWNSTILKGAKIEIPTGHFMDPNGTETAEGNLWIVTKKIYADHAEYGVTYYDIEAAKTRGTAPRYGNGTLARITLTILAIGRTMIRLKDTILGDEEAHPIEHITADCSFDNRPPPQPAQIYVEPDRIVDPTLTPCNNFDVNISIINATSIYSYNFTLTYDPTILEVTNANVGDFFPPTAMYTINIDNNIGFINVRAWLSPPESSVSGNGRLALITFHVKGLGPSALTLTETTILDDMGNPLPITAVNGFFNNILVGKLYVDPQEIIDPTMLPPSWFAINVTLDDVEDLYHYEFALEYDTAILTCYGAMINPDLNGIRPKGVISFNDPAGLITVNVSFDPPASPVTTYSPLPLVTIFFQVDSIGWTNLDIKDANLTNSNGDLISHEVEDGFFMTLIRDVAVLNVAANETDIYPGWFVSINITVKNEGNISETFNVEVYYEGNLIGVISVTNLAPDESATLTIEWNTTAIPYCHNYTIIAHIPPIPFELDTTDNTVNDGKVKIRIPGDVNGDGQVNILDCITASNTFGSTLSDPNWDRYSDINQDGRVNVLDMIRIAANFGKNC